MMWLAALFAALLVATPFPLLSEPQQTEPAKIYEGMDVQAGLAETADGVLAVRDGSVVVIDENGAAGRHPGSEARFVAGGEGGTGFVLAASGGEIRIIEVGRADGTVRLAERCRLRGAGEPVRATRLISSGLWGVETRSGGLLVDIYTCKTKRFGSPFSLGKPRDTTSGIPFVHDGQAFVARATGGEIELTRIEVEGDICGAPVARGGYVAVPLESGIALATPSLISVFTYQHRACHRSDEVIIAVEQKRIYLPLDNGFSFYRLDSKRRRLNHFVDGTAKLLGAFGQDMFWAYLFERDGKNYVNLFRFNRRSAQLFGRYPLESKGCGEFARSGSGLLALELDDRIVVYEGRELEPILQVPKSGDVVCMVAHGRSFFALTEGGRLLVLPAGRGDI